MSYKNPLRLFSLADGRAGGRPLLQWGSLLALCVLVFLGIWVFYFVSIRWFRSEFSRAVFELTQKEALSTSKTIADTVTQALTGRRPTPQVEDDLSRSIIEFIRHNPNVIGVIITDADGRIFKIQVLPQAAKSPALQEAEKSGGSLQGFSEESFLRALAAEQPQLKTIPSNITRNGVPIGGITFLVDPTITTQSMDVAIARMTSSLTTLLGVMGLLVALVILLARRQQGIARRQSEQRSEVERLAYVGTLAAGLAHEIRNPLNALAMQLELLEEDVGEGAPQLVAPRLQHIRKGLAGVERTVHDFLTYATPGRQQPQSIELATIVGALCAEVAQNASEPELRMECLVAPGLAVWCDPHALRLILGNLFSNALRAQKNRSGRIRVEATRQGSWVEICVDDAGTGVPAEARDRVFDCFYTTQSEGTGLGLPIARRMAEMNGGVLTLMSEPSPLGGARFCLRLSSQPRPSIFD